MIRLQDRAGARVLLHILSSRRCWLVLVAWCAALAAGILSGCLALHTPVEGRPILKEGRRSIVAGRLRIVSGESEYSFWRTFPPLLPPDVRLMIQVVQLKPRKLSVRAPIREGGWFYWRLPPGRYLLIGHLYRPSDEPDVSPQPLTTCLPEGVPHGVVYGVPTLAVFDVPETEEAIYLGTLKVEVTVTVLLDLSIDEFVTDICVRSVGIFDEIEAQTKDLRDAYPGTRMAPVTRLMITGLNLPTPQDTDLERSVDEVLRARAAP